MATLEQQVLGAKSPREALILIARAVDALRAEPTLDSWDGWVPDGQAPRPLSQPLAPAPAHPRINPEDLTDDVVKMWIARNYKNGVVLDDSPEARAAIAQVREDMLNAPNVEVVEDLFRVTTEGIVESDLDWSPLTQAHHDARYQFAQRILNLDVALGPHPEGEGHEWAEDYAQGGPMWFYIPNRDLVMQYPERVRSQMVEDVRVTTHARSPQHIADKLTNEFGADVLKAPMSTDREGGAPQPMGFREDQL